MTGAHDIELMIGVDGVYRRVPLVAIAATLHENPHELRDALSKLFFALLDQSAEDLPLAEREPPEGETVSDGYGSPGYGSVPNGSLGTVLPEQKENGLVSEGTVPTVTTEPSARPASARGEALTAQLLADLLDDAASLPFYETLVATVDHRHIQHALDVTLARRAHLHGRPGGYFNAVVRRLTHSHPPYARTPTSTPGAASPRP